MGINSISKAVDDYQKLMDKATEDYERIMREAESQLKATIESAQIDPPKKDVVTMSRSDYESLQKQLNVVGEFIKQHPELK